MIKNIIKIAFRNLIKDKFYSLINILGLSIGIAASLLILLYITDELSYDRYHTDSESIYRIITKAKLGEEETMQVAVSPAPMASGFANAIAEIEAATRITPRNMVFQHNGDIYREKNIYLADSTFFDVFDFKILQGSTKTALTDHNTLVLTKNTAIKYFGVEAFNEGVIIGETIKSNETIYQITAIIENVPSNSHFVFDMLLPMIDNPDALNQIWLNMNYWTYVKLSKGVDPVSLKDKTNEIALSTIIPQAIQYMNVPEEMFSPENINDNFGYFFQPIHTIHLHSNLQGELGVNGNITYIYIFTAIAIFIMVIAVINFMNLATARSSNRAKEVGIRKTLGSDKYTLVYQFLLESFLYVSIAMIIALGLTEAFRIPFNLISGKSLSFNIFEQYWIFGTVIGMTLIIGLLAGSYPAFYLTRFKPVDVLKGSPQSGVKSSLMRSSLVVIQFVISIGLIICTTLVYKQMRYFQTKDVGFDKENVIVLGNGNDLREIAQPLKEELINQSDIINASYSSRVPSHRYNSTVFKAEGDLEVDHRVFTTYVDYDFLETMGMKLAYGRNFSIDMPTDSAAVLINESAAKIFGWYGDESDDNNALNKIIESIQANDGTRIKYKIVGVIKDFNFESLHSEVRPIAIHLSSGSQEYLCVRVRTGNINDKLNFIESKWKEMAPLAPFEYSFLDENFETLFEREKQLGMIVSVFTVLAIFIACLGLLGLAAFISEQRTKEIGVRKAMGATIPNVVRMLSKEFTKLVIISFIIAAPIAWYLMINWLETFAYKIEITFWPFIMSGGAALIISWLTISYQSIKAAMANPVDSLRNE